MFIAFSRRNALLMIITFMLPAHTYAQGAVKTIDGAAFCDSLAGTIYLHPAFYNIASEQKGILAVQSAVSIIDQIRQGKLKEYLNTQSFNPNANAAYLSTEMLLRQALQKFKGSPRPVFSPANLVFGAENLRFLPHIQQGSQLILLTSAAGSLNLERSQVVVQTATRLSVQISVIWLGDSLSQDAINVAYISAFTGGVFVNLADSKNPCTSKI